jgi:hypothetical protein
MVFDCAPVRPVWIIIPAIVCVIVGACTSSHDDWLEAYRRALCDSTRLALSIGGETSAERAADAARLDSLQKALTAVESQFEAREQEVSGELKETKAEFERRYRRIKDEHFAVHGHDPASEPSLMRALAAASAAEEAETKRLDRNLAALREQMRTDHRHARIAAELAAIDSAQRARTAVARAGHSGEVVRVEQELASARAGREATIQSHLPKDRNEFRRELREIEAHPCSK